MSALPHPSPFNPEPHQAAPARTPPSLKNLLFSPPEDQIDHILDRLLDPQFSLSSVAFDFHTTIAALNLWLARPDIDERLSSLESICARRARLIAANHLPFAVQTITRVLQEYNEDEYLNPGDKHSRENKRRWHETARKSVALLFRISTYDPAKPRRLNPRGNVGGAGATRVAHLTAAAGALPTHYTTTISFPSTAPSFTSDIAHPASHIDSSATGSVAAATNRPDCQPTPTTTPDSSSLKFHTSDSSSPTSDIAHPTSNIAPPLATIRPVSTSPGYSAHPSPPPDDNGPVDPITGLYPPLEPNAHLYPPAREPDWPAWFRKHGDPAAYYASQPNHPLAKAAQQHLNHLAASTPKEPLASPRGTRATPNKPESPVPLTCSAHPRAP